MAMFFFYSGYGLFLSADKENYLKSFFRNRFLPLYCFHTVLIAVYSLWTILLDKNLSIKAVIGSFLFGETVITFGWYMQTTFIMYLVFLLIFSVFKSKNLRLILFGIASVAYFVLCDMSSLGSWWYQTIFALTLGMIYCYKKDKIDKILKKYSILVFIATSILFIIFALLRFESIMFTVLYSLLFVCAAVSLSYILCETKIINNSFFSLLGKYSLEIYLTHGMFIRLIKKLSIENKLISILAIFAGTAVMSVIMRIVYVKLIDLISTKKKKASA